MTNEWERFMLQNEQDLEGRTLPEYSQPEITDFGTLVELTEVGGSVHPKDVPHGKSDSAYPS